MFILSYMTYPWLMVQLTLHESSGATSCTFIIELSHVLILLPNTGDGLILLLLHLLQQYRNEFYLIPITVLLLCT